MIISWTWDFWTLFWISIVPIGLLVWMTMWVTRRYTRTLTKCATAQLNPNKTIGRVVA